jgi:hypothetical protein
LLGGILFFDKTRVFGVEHTLDLSEFTGFVCFALKEVREERYLPLIIININYINHSLSKLLSSF